MLEKVGALFSRWSERWVPDPFVLSLGLTVLVLAMGLAVSGSFTTVLTGWFDGFSSVPLLAFALQMCLILVSGQALASSPPIQRWVRLLARWPRNTTSAAGLVAVVACVTGLIQWGLGAVVAAFVVREIGATARDEGRTIHLPILGASAYTGLAVWHGGLSGSAPLKAAESAQFTQGIGEAIPVGATLFSPLNLVVSGGLVILLPVLCMALAPRSADAQVSLPPKQSPTAPIDQRDSSRSPIAFGVGGAVVLLVAGGWLFGGLAFDLNSVNLFFLSLALAAHRSVQGFLDAVGEGARGAGAIIVQFPLYFGILGAMKATGMIAGLSELMVSVASPTTFPLLTFLSAGFVNFFVPSGGGQWALQSDVLLSSANALGLDQGKTIMAFAYGDEWTNLFQPFWALPLLAITGLEARQIAGYTALLAIGMGLYVGLALMLFG